MAKTKTPFMSLGSRGTVGGSLTSQKRGSATILREKPIPTDPYSLKQAYQRWDYRDYAYLWTLLSNADKQIYRSRGSRYHITGFSQWMREQLKTLPNLLGRWRLDEHLDAIAYDSSKQGNPGTIIGASPATGIIGPCLDFDGINDHVYFGTKHFYTEPATIECFIKLGDATQVSKAIIGHLSKHFWGSYGDGFTYHNGFLYLMSELNNNKAALWVALTDTASWHHLAGEVWSPNGKLFLDGELVDSGDLDSGYVAYTWGIGASQDDGTATGNFFDGLIDNVRINQPPLDATEVKRHSERRWPRQ